MTANLRQVAVLALVAALAAAAIALVQLATGDRIVAARRAAEQHTLLTLLPSTPDTALQLEERLAPADADLPGWAQPQRVFIARRGAEPVAAILPASVRGYGGAIRLLVGLDTDGRITGLRVVSHRETAGLGDRMEPGKSDWLRQFQGHSLQSTPSPKWEVKREQGEFDQLTGATVTSRAVIAALRETLDYFAAHRAELMAATTAGETTHER